MRKTISRALMVAAVALAACQDSPTEQWPVAFSQWESCPEEVLIYHPGAECRALDQDDRDTLLGIFGSVYWRSGGNCDEYRSHAEDFINGNTYYIDITDPQFGGETYGSGEINIIGVAHEDDPYVPFHEGGHFWWNDALSGQPLNIVNGWWDDNPWYEGPSMVSWDYCTSAYYHSPADPGPYVVEEEWDPDPEASCDDEESPYHPCEIEEGANGGGDI